MKSFVIGTMLLSCFSSYSMTVIPLNEVYSIINNPVDIDSNLRFSQSSSYSGVCRRLGFTEYVETGLDNNDAQFDQELLLLVNRFGRLEQAAQGKSIKNITCGNKVKIEIGDKAYIPDNLNDPSTGLPFGIDAFDDMDTNFGIEFFSNLICRTLGYSDHLKYSLMLDLRREEYAVPFSDLKMNLRNKISKMYPVRKIVCINKIAQGSSINVENEVVVKNPIHPDLGLPFEGQIKFTIALKNAICKKLGYNQAMPHRILKHAALKEPTVLINESGTPSRISKAFPITQLSCLK